MVCKAFVEELNTQDVPKLVTVKTKDEQQFLQKLMFEDIGTLDTFWLGLDLVNNGSFQWNDGTDLDYTNWAEEAKMEALMEANLETMVDHERNCVQMESGEGAYETGIWGKVNCQKRNAVVCERNQPWTVTELQNILLSLKLEFEKTKRQSDEQITYLMSNQVPIGFIYVQLPNQSPPSTIWPEMKWQEVTSSYSGLFFRAAGGKAASFGQTQEENSPRLTNVKWEQPNNDGSSTAHEHSLLANGDWSEKVFSGDMNGDTDMYLRFKISKGEVRPRNSAVLIWKRVA